MAKKELSKQATRFRNKILRELKPDMINDCQFHFSFETKDDEEHFHLDVIEDYCSHLHVRGYFYDEKLITITSIKCDTTRDTYDEVTQYLSENF